jgi:hypothetical protein
VPGWSQLFGHVRCDYLAGCSSGATKPAQRSPSCEYTQVTLCSPRPGGTVDHLTRPLSIVASLSKSSAVARSLGSTTKPCQMSSQAVVGDSKFLLQSIGTGAVSPGNASSRRVYCENGLHMQARSAVEPVNARTGIELRPVLGNVSRPCLRRSVAARCRGS